MSDPTNYIEATLPKLIEFVQVSERLSGAISQLDNVGYRVHQLCESDPELAPEILAAINSMQEAIDALGRAHKFIAARLHVKLEEEQP